MRPRLLRPCAARALSPLPSSLLPVRLGPSMPAAPQPGEGGSFIPFAPFSGDDIWRWQVGAAFERLIFQPEPSHLEASETDGQPRGRLSGSEGVKMSRLS